MVRNVKGSKGSVKGGGGKPPKVGANGGKTKGK